MCRYVYIYIEMEDDICIREMCTVHKHICAVGIAARTSAFRFESCTYIHKHPCQHAHTPTRPFVPRRSMCRPVHICIYIYTHILILYCTYICIYRYIPMCSRHCRRHITFFLIHVLVQYSPARGLFLSLCSFDCSLCLSRLRQCGHLDNFKQVLKVFVGVKPQARFLRNLQTLSGQGSLCKTRLDSTKRGRERGVLIAPVHPYMNVDMHTTHRDLALLVGSGSSGVQGGGTQGVGGQDEGNPNLVVTLAILATVISSTVLPTALAV